MVSYQRSIRRIAASALFCGCLASATGCALIPSWDDVHDGTKFVKDTVTGKAKRDKLNQAFAEARILERRQDYAGAEKLYRDLLKARPESRDCYHRLAVMASQQHKFDEAMALYRQALNCGEPSPDLWNDVGYCHYLQQQLPEAEGALQQALKMQPQHRAALNNLAMVMGEQGNLEAAYSLFRQAGSEAEAEANLGYLCTQVGDLPRAQYHYSRALSCDPTMRSATDALLQVTKRLQMLQDRAVVQASATDPNQPGAVRQADGSQPLQSNERRMIEVFTASPPRHLPPAARPNSSEANSAASSAPPPATIAPPSLHQQTPASPLVGGAKSAAPQPFSFPQQTQPQYLQPRFGPAGGNVGSAGGNAGGTGGVNGQAAGGTTPAATSNPGTVMQAGGPFPPLVGGASTLR